MQVLNDCVHMDVTVHMGWGGGWILHEAPFFSSSSVSRSDGGMQAAVEREADGSQRQLCALAGHEARGLTQGARALEQSLGLASSGEPRAASQSV